MVAIKISKQDELRLRICQFKNSHSHKPNKFTVEHFMNEGIPRSTIYSILGRLDKNISCLRKKGSGRIAKKMDKKRINQLKKMLNHHDGVSQRQAARRFNCSVSYINEIISTKTDIKYYKKKKIPYRNENQLTRIKPLCRYLYRNFRNFDFILDDESYFTLSNTTLSGNDGFYSDNLLATPSDVKYNRKKKYEEKVLVSLIISPKGISKPFVAKSRQAINSKTYIETLRKHLVPLINEHHKNGNYLFWPDLASSHYADDVIRYLEANNINFVPKERNPPAVPEARPIEDFWGELKRLVYEGNWQTTRLSQLLKPIEYCLTKIDPKVAKRYAQETPIRLGRIAYRNVIEKQ